MRFYDSILNYLQKRKAEKEAKGKSISSVVVLLCAAIGSLGGSAVGVTLPILGLSFNAALPLVFSLFSVFTLGGILTAKLIVWPRLQRMLAESDDNFNYNLFVESEFESRLEKIRSLKVSTRTKQRWEEEAYERYSEDLRKHQDQIDRSRLRLRDHQRMMSEATRFQQELARVLSGAAAREIEEQVAVHLNERRGLNPASANSFLDMASTQEKAQDERAEVYNKRNSEMPPRDRH
jgi:hypothetical protein